MGLEFARADCDRTEDSSYFVLDVTKKGDLTKGTLIESVNVRLAEHCAAVSYLQFQV